MEDAKRGAELLAAFVGAAPADWAAQLDRDRLGEALCRAVDRGRAAWPGLALDETWLAAALGARLGDPALDAARLDAAPADDLALAAACGDGLPGAAVAFEAALGADLEAIVGRTIAAPQLREEAAQRVRQHLLVAAPGARPRIAGYLGRAPLRAYVRVIATRIAIDVLRGERGDRHIADDGAAAALPDPGVDLELGLLQRRYGAPVRAAIAAGTAALAARERTLLRYHLVDGLSIDKLAVIYDVHRATVARQLERARVELLQHVKRELASHVGASGDELISIVRMVRSQLDLSVRELLASAPE